MSTIPTDESIPGDDGDIDSSDEERSPPRWWWVLWTVWGLVVGLLVFWLDRNIVAGACLCAVGVAIGAFAPRLLAPLAPLVFDWYHDYARDPNIEFRLHELLLKDDTDSDEFRRLCAHDAYGALLAMPPIVGLMHGTLVGGIVGALSSADPTLNFSAASGALYGVLLGIPSASFLAAIVFAFFLPRDPTLSCRRLILRRLRMLVSPFLVLAVGWNCVRHSFRRPP